MPWLSLGTKTPVLGQWVLYDTDSINGRTFRFTPGNLQGKSGWPEFKTYALVRMAWVDGGTVNRTPSFRVYPRNESIVMDLAPPPEILEKAGGIVWTPEVQKIIYRRWMGRSNEPTWNLKVEEWEPTVGEEPYQSVDGGLY